MNTLTELMQDMNTREEGTTRAYGELESILISVLAQASAGKGKERHSNGKRWSEQPWSRIVEAHGPGFLLGQAAKKMQECQKFEETARIEAELLGAMHYLAMAIHYYHTTATEERT